MKIKISTRQSEQERNKQREFKQQEKRTTFCFFLNNKTRIETNKKMANWE
ncbi:MAG: hypothetical protein H0U27_13745 [Nitrosopumilus sp.]|nr:hypothetical protein [Nitrosopumilus sp.]